MTKFSLKITRVVTSMLLSIMFIFILSIMYTTEYDYVSSYLSDNVIYHGNTTKSNVALMFNVYSGSEYVENILSILNKYAVKSTFFIGGVWAEKSLNTLYDIYINGHEIANHGYLHRDHNKIDYDANADEIMATHNLIKQYLSIDMHLFAPPSGAFNKATISACNDLDYSVIMWTRDTIDWRDQDSNIIYNRAINGVGNGDLVLMHPTYATVKALPMIITYLIASNYNITTVSECL